MRFRLYLTPEQEVLLAQHCAHARFVWNLAVEQLGYPHDRQPLPNYVAQSQQGDGSVVGIDRGVAVTLARSDGATYQAPPLLGVRKAARALSRCRRGSHRRKRAKVRLARLHGRRVDRRRDFVEKASTTIARRYDVIRIDDLRVANMVRSARGAVDQPGRNVAQKAGLNRSIRNAAWTAFATRLEDKAAGRVVNAARNIAAGRAVTARGGPALAGLVNREPQRVASSVA